MNCGMIWCESCNALGVCVYVLVEFDQVNFRIILHDELIPLTHQQSPI